MRSSQLAQMTKITKSLFLSIGAGMQKEPVGQYVMIVTA